jgi:hypothetical protein
MAETFTRAVSRSRYTKMCMDAWENLKFEIAAHNLGKPNYQRIKPVSFEEFLGSRRHVAAYARYKIFRELRAMGFSYPSLAKVSGFDHTTVIVGIRALEALERAATDATPSENIAPAELTQGAAYLDQPTASIEIEVIAVAA